MNDRELLEAAAKAAGLHIHLGRQSERDEAGLGHVGLWIKSNTRWNPLTDDGDALRLAVKLRVRFWVEGGSDAEAGKSWVVAEHMRGPEHFVDVVDEDEATATRRAIVRAAAAMAPVTA